MSKNQAAISEKKDGNTAVLEKDPPEKPRSKFAWSPNERMTGPACLILGNGPTVKDGMPHDFPWGQFNDVIGVNRCLKWFEEGRIKRLTHFLCVDGIHIEGRTDYDDSIYGDGETRRAFYERYKRMWKGRDLNQLLIAGTEHLMKDPAPRHRYYADGVPYYRNTTNGIVFLGTDIPCDELLFPSQQFLERNAAKQKRYSDVPPSKHWGEHLRLNRGRPDGSVNGLLRLVGKCSTVLTAADYAMHYLNAKTIVFAGFQYDGSKQLFDSKGNCSSPSTLEFAKSMIPYAAAKGVTLRTLDPESSMWRELEKV